MSAPSRVSPPTTPTTTTSASNEHVLQLSLLGASLESVVDIVSREDTLLFSVRTHDKDRASQRVEIVEVVKGRVLGTTKPEWIYAGIRELIKVAYREEWIIKRLDF
jgi:hypothetical protein